MARNDEIAENALEMRITYNNPETECPRTEKKRLADRGRLITARWSPKGPRNNDKVALEVKAQRLEKGAKHVPSAGLVGGDTVGTNAGCRARGPRVAVPKSAHRKPCPAACGCRRAESFTSAFLPY